MSNPTDLNFFNNLINFDKLRNAVEETFRQGFKAGLNNKNYNNTEFLENIEFINFKKQNLHLFVCCTKEEIKLLREYEEWEYQQKIKLNNEIPDQEEDV